MAKKVPEPGGMRGGRALALGAVAVLLVYVGFEFGQRSGSDGEPPTVEVPRESDAVRLPDAPSPPVAPVAKDENHPSTPDASASGQWRVALVIDDLGRSVETVKRLEALGVELSYAVLPFETRTAEVTAHLRDNGREILCHLPMEPSGRADPGPGALFGSMDAAELRRRTSAALDAVPGAVGVNNHMGSGLSANLQAMEVVLSELDRRALFFLDSRTSAETVGYSVAGRLGLERAERDVFLDRVIERRAIGEQFRRTLKVARDQGTAVAIGHPYPETLAVLEAEIPRSVADGYRFVAVSNVLDAE